MDIYTEKEANRRDQFLDRLITDNIGAKTRVLQNKKLQDIPSGSQVQINQPQIWDGPKEEQSNISIRNSNDWFQKQVINQNIDKALGGVKIAGIKGTSLHGTPTQIQHESSRNQLLQLKQKRMGGLRSNVLNPKEEDPKMKSHQKSYQSPQQFQKQSIGYLTSQTADAGNISSKNLDQIPNMMFQNEANGASHHKIENDGEIRNDSELIKRRKQSRLNLSMQFDPKDLKKFGRYVDQFFCDKDRKGQSIDFKQDELKALFNSNNLIDEPIRQKSNTKTPPIQLNVVDRKARRRNQFSSNYTTQDKTVDRYQDYSQEEASPTQDGDKLPIIKNTTASIMANIYEKNNNSYGIRADGRTLMSYRETGFKLNPELMKDKLKGLPMNLNNSYTFASNHNKFNRLKDGAWGTSNIHNFPGVFKPTGVNLNSQLDRIKIQNVLVTKKKEKKRPKDTQNINEQVFGRDEELEYSNSVKNLNSMKQTIQQTNQLTVTKGKKQINSKQTTIAIADYLENLEKPMNEYSTQTQQEIINQQTIQLRGSHRKERDQFNQSLISSGTDNSIGIGGDKMTLNFSPNKTEEKERERGSPLNDLEITPINQNLKTSIQMNVDSTKFMAAGQRLQNQIIMQQSKHGYIQPQLSPNPMHQIDINAIPFASGIESSYDSLSNGLNYSDMRLNPQGFAQSYQTDRILTNQLHNKKAGYRLDRSYAVSVSPGDLNRDIGLLASASHQESIQNYSNDKWIRRELRGGKTTKNGAHQMSIQQKFEQSKLQVKDKKYNIQKSGSISIQRLEERKQREYFNEQFEQLKKRQPNQISDALEEKQLIRRQRDQIQEQIKQLHAQIKNKKRTLEGQFAENKKAKEQLEQQIDINQRLLGLDYIQKQISLSSMMSPPSNNQQTNEDIQNQNFQFGHQPQQITDEYQYTFAQGSIRSTDQSRTGFEPLTNRSAGQDIHGLYKFLFESDLKIAKDRTLEQLESAREVNDTTVKETDVLKLQNEQVKKFIRRYKTMIDDLLGKNKKSGQSGASSQLSLSPVRQSNTKLDMTTINMQMYKYGGGEDKQSEERSSFIGNMMNSTPAFNNLQSVGRTQISFGVGRAPLYIELRKAETMTMQMPTIFRQEKPLDAVILQLQIFKDIFKAQKITLFIIDSDLQDKIFQNKNERKQNYKKLIMGGSSLVYACYTSEAEFAGPVFKTIDDAHNYVFNNKSILIPMKEKKTTLMSLQVIFDENMKVHTEKAVNRGAAVPRQNNTVLSSKKKSKMGGTGAQQVNIPGWTQNDFNFMKILSGFMQMNIEYYALQVVKKQKRQIKLDVIDFAFDFMSVKSFRHIVSKANKYARTLLGYEACNIFFKYQDSNELFTITQLNVEAGTDPKLTKSGIDTSFAKELFFEGDQFMEFPPTLGVSGEVHEKKGIKYENNFGMLISKDKNEGHHGSEDSSISISRRGSLSNNIMMNKPPNHPIITQGSNAFNKQSTMLERIMEDAPHAENETLKELGRNLINRRQSDGGGFTQPQIQIQISGQKVMDGIMISEGSPSPNPVLQKHLLSPQHIHMQASLNSSPEKDNFDGYLKEIEETNSSGYSQKGKKADKKPGIAKRMTATTPTAFKDLEAASGNILDLSMRKVEKKKYILPEKEIKYFSEFVPDMDNFVGIKNINNYIISSIRDDPINKGQVSVGILQLYNKVGGKNIGKEDVNRVTHFANFIGGLSIKAHVICSALTQMIGLNLDFNKTERIIGELDINTDLQKKQELYSLFSSTRDQFIYENGFANQDQNGEESGN